MHKEPDDLPTHRLKTNAIGIGQGSRPFGRESFIADPQPDPQFLRSCTTSALLGSPRGGCKSFRTWSGSAVTAEVAGSSPVVPAIHSKRVTERMDLV
jgi:hypothetical protein